MSLPSGQTMVESELIPNTGAMEMVVAINELIFMILDALREPVDLPSRRLLHTKKKYPPSRWLSQNERNYRNCMLVNRRWCHLAQKFLWKDLAFPRVAFHSVLQQFETTTAKSLKGVIDDRQPRRPREAYIRYCFYAAMVESMMIHRVTKEEDLELCAQLEHFGLNHDVFPRLKKITLATKPDELWFPAFTHKHGITDIRIEIVNSTHPIRVMQAISQYCPKVERLVINGLLHQDDIEFLQTNRFEHLTTLSVDVSYLRIVDLMRMTASISHNLTDLALFRTQSLGKIAESGGSFRSLLTLRLYDCSLRSNYIADLPDAPRLQTLLIRFYSTNYSWDNGSHQAFQAITEYSKRSPFSKLQMDNPPDLRLWPSRIDFSDLSATHSLTELSITMKSSVTEGAIYTLPQRLQALTLVLGKDQKPSVSLYHLFCLVAQAPNLRSVTAQVDLRIGSNAGFLVPQEDGAHGTEHAIREQPYPYDFRPDIMQYQASSLRALDFKSSPLRKRDQLFLFSVLQELAPNLEISTKMLKSLHWRPKKVANIAMLYLETSTNQSLTTIAGLVELLSSKK